MIGLFIILIMTMSVLGIYANSGQDNQNKYNGYAFKQTNSGFSTKVNDKEITFYNPPASLEYISFDNESKQILKNAKVLYITFDPNDTAIQEIELARLELTRQLQENFNTYTIVAVTNVTVPYTVFNQVTCKNATITAPVLYFKTGDITQVTTENNCIIATAGNKGGILAIKDKIMLLLFNIMN